MAITCNNLVHVSSLELSHTKLLNFSTDLPEYFLSLRINKNNLKSSKNIVPLSLKYVLRCACLIAPSIHLNEVFQAAFNLRAYYLISNTLFHKTILVKIWFNNIHIHICSYARLLNTDTAESINLREQLVLSNPNFTPAVNVTPK